MATTKTLTPTNQAITIAAFTEKPDNRFNATNDDKLADAVNALNSNITPIGFNITTGEKVSSYYTIRMRMGKLCIISGYLSINAQLSNGDVIMLLPFSATNAAYRFMFAKNDGSGKCFFAKLNTSNQIVVDGGTSGTGNDQYYLFNIVFFTD